MIFELLQSAATNLWAIILVAFFFGASILVHELGHFWAARLRGVRVQRFSIGFGPAIFRWTGKDGVEYWLSWIPLGGYVMLPQLADMSEIEGKPDPAAVPLPEPSYLTKIIVFAAGAFMNIVFALALGCIIWIAGQTVSDESSTTQVGYISPTVELSDGSSVASPASRAGLKAGDIVRSIDGEPVREWLDVMQAIVLGDKTAADGRPKADFVIEREGKSLELTVYPQLAGSEKDRRVGIAPAHQILIHSVAAGSLADKAGFKAGDRILSLDGSPIIQIAAMQELLTAKPEASLPMRLRRGEAELELPYPPHTAAKTGNGLLFTLGTHVEHPTPFRQITDMTALSFRTLRSLVSPGSNIGLSKMSGPVGIVRNLHSAAEAGLIPIIGFTILINVSLAIFNLLPIPVLDGGHILFATIGRLRGRPLPVSFVAGAQRVFIVLLLTMIAYVSIHDIRRIGREHTAPATARPPSEAPAK